MGDAVAIGLMLVGCAGYLIGYWAGHTRAKLDRLRELQPWLSMVRGATERHEALLICGRPYIAARWADEPSKERMH